MQSFQHRREFDTLQDKIEQKVSLKFERPYRTIGDHKGTYTTIPGNS